MAETIIRPATQADLAEVVRIWDLAEGREPVEVVAAGQVPAVLPHVMRSGVLQVAERNGTILGFGSSYVRGDVRFLAQLFMLPGRQSTGIGRALMESVMPHDGLIQGAVASPDFRAVSLYVRHGMTPVWPVYGLKVDLSSLPPLSSGAVCVVTAEPGDPELIRMDAALNGRNRPEDHTFWLEHKGGVPLWLEREGKRVGYAYLQVQRTSSDAALDNESVRVGPLGCRDPVNALDCLLAAIKHARQFGSRVTVLIPGSHPTLRHLLDAGFRITYFDTFLTSANPPFIDGRRYVPSGGGLF